MKTYTGVKKTSVTLGLGLLLLCLGQNNARAVTLPDVPLSVFSGVEHNVLLTFDDSGSMSWGYMPDAVENGPVPNDTGATGLIDQPRGCANEINGIAYNPATTYSPPPVRTYPGNLPDTTPPQNLPAASFTAAWTNGFSTASGTVNLSTSYRPVWVMNNTLTTNTTFASCGSAPLNTAQPAFYYMYNTTLGGCSPRTTTTEGLDGCYSRIIVSATSGPGATDERTNFANWYSYYRVRNLAAKSGAGRAFRGLPKNVRVAAQHLNNGSTTAGPAAGITFTNTTSTTTANMLKRFCDDPLNNDSTCRDGSTARVDFFTRLYNSPAANTTPLQTAMQRAGNSFGSTNTGIYSPYRAIPGDPVSATNTELSCRKNFHILMTDGFWNGTTVSVGNTDGIARTLGDGTAYAPIPPYSDGWSVTLADLAFDYWARDLRTDLTNNVPHTLNVGTADPLSPPNPPNPWYAGSLPWDPRNNPARWQHMQTFTIGLGVSGQRNPANYFTVEPPTTPVPPYTAWLNSGDWDELRSGGLGWPQPVANTLTTIDDLWHAAVNARGKYFSAREPGALANAFTQIIGEVSRDTGSAAGLGSSGSTTSGGTSIYQVAYDTKTWAGRLLSRPVDVNGAPLAATWEAGTVLNTQNYAYPSRHILTYNPGSGGVAFDWPNLSVAQQTALNTDPLTNLIDTNGPARLNYLRGASANEGTGNGLGFRERTCYNPASVSVKTISGLIPDTVPCSANVGKLGDIVDSSPVYVGKPDFGYPDTIEGVGNEYSAFVTAQAGREKMVYVGANDGMLHGFRASDGNERMAYVPNLVYTNIDQKNLSLLTSPYYTHRFYVNATPTVGDVFFNSDSKWHTMLVGGLRKGGRGYYALDITNPSGFSETNAAQIVKWEFPTPANPEPDMGFSYSQPKIVKLANGRWAAVFGNGYKPDSEATGTGHSVIFIVDVEDGTLIQKIDTFVSGGGGTLAIPNGMSTPAVVDMNDDYIADYIYAGDLYGTMWRIDVRSPTPTDWALAANVTPLFTTAATPATASVQPITTKPSVGFHPTGFGGLMVYFGTGKYLNGDDNTATGVQPTQTFYGIYDRGVSGRSAEPSRREATPITKAALLQQTIDITVGTVGAFRTRNVSDNPINWRLDRASTTTHLGWYVTLPENGEKQVTNSLLREGRIIFTTLSPGTDACTPEGTGWLMELDSANGGRIDETLDLDGDGLFGTGDNSGLAYGAAGAQVSGGGGLSSPIVLTNPQSAPPPYGSGPRYSETKLVVTSKGAVVSMKESGTPMGPEGWRQPK